MRQPVDPAPRHPPTAPAAFGPTSALAVASSLEGLHPHSAHSGLPGRREQQQQPEQHQKPDPSQEGARSKKEEEEEEGEVFTSVTAALDAIGFGRWQIGMVCYCGLAWFADACEVREEGGLA